MMNAGDKCYIVTISGQYCKKNEQNDLVIARARSEAELFTRQEAEARIGKGHKLRFYHIEDAVLSSTEAAESSTPKCDARKKTYTMFEGYHYDWEDMLSQLSYMSNHMAEYQKKLHGLQSDVDQEISDIMHYLEFTNPDKEEMLRASQMLQELRRKRREITNEIEKANLICTAFLDKDFGAKVQKALDRMERMKVRQYTPRKLTDPCLLYTSPSPRDA